MRLLALVALLVVGCAAPQPRAHVRGFSTSPQRSGGDLVLGEVDEESVLPVMRELQRRPEVLTLVLDSPGGSVYAGLVLIDAMQSAQADGTKIVCMVPRMAASMAATILQACDVRLMGHQAALLFHTVSVGGASGNQWELERLVREMASLNKRLNIFIAGRLSITLAEYEAEVADRDWWLGWQEAMEVGAVDSVF